MCRPLNCYSRELFIVEKQSLRIRCWIKFLSEGISVFKNVVLFSWSTIFLILWWCLWGYSHADMYVNSSQINTFIIWRNKVLEAEDRSLWEMHCWEEYICQLRAIVKNFREDEKPFHDSKRFVTQRRENEANRLHLSLHLNRQHYSCFHHVVFILMLEDFHLYKILIRNGVTQVRLS